LTPLALRGSLLKCSNKDLHHVSTLKVFDLI